jgi:hypothetical protein
LKISSILLKSVDDWKKRRREKQKPKAPAQENVQNNLNRPQTSINSIQSTSLINFKTNTQPLKAKSPERKIYEEPPKIVPKISPSQSSPSIINNQKEEQQHEQEEESQENEDNCIQKNINIIRPFDHPTRGFGFLINKNTNKKYAQIVVVEQDSLADKAGLEKNDQVIEINSNSTENLNNEQLRKIMRERLQQNSVDLIILRALLKGKPIHDNKYKNNNITHLHFFFIIT